MATTALVRKIQGSQVADNAASATFSESTALDNTNGLVAIVRRYGAKSVGVTVATPSGWTLAGSQLADNGTTQIGTWVFCMRGDGSTNSITVAGITSLTTRVNLLGFSLATPQDTFWDGFLSVGAANLTTQTIAAAASSTPNAVLVGFTSLSGVAGGTGFSFTPTGTVINTTGSADSMNGVVTAAIATPTATTYTASWTSTTVATSAAFWVKGAVPVITLGTIATHDDIYKVDLTSTTTTSGGSLTYAASVSTGVVQPTTGIFYIYKQSAPFSITFTISDSGGSSPVTTTVTIPGYDEGLEELIRIGGVWT